MAKHFSKVRKQEMNLQLPAIRKLCQDACQRLMLHPYITASRTIVNIQALGTKRPVASLEKGDFIDKCHSFLSSKCGASHAS